MSIINRMLQDLDRRQGTADQDATLAMSQVRSVPSARKDREWFWRIIAALMIVALGWVGWIAWQLQPREPIVTELAFRAAEKARKPTPAPAPAAAPAPAPAPERPAAQLPPAKPTPQPLPGTLKLAPEIQTPIKEPAPKAATKESAKPAAKEATQATRVAAPAAKEPAKPAAPAEAKIVEAPAAKGTSAPVQTVPKVEKRDRIRTPEERAEAEFRRAAALLNQGRTGEAEESFSAALASYPGHEAARQALIAIHLEQRRMDEARRLLQEGLAVNPANTRFAAVLARLHIERKDYPAALDVVNAVRTPEQGGPEFQLIRGTVLQRMGRHAEASEAFRASLRGAPQNGAAWMALGISLEAQGKRPEAADAYRRAAATSGLSVEARDYSEQKARELQ